MKKISSVLKNIFGYGIMLCLFAGGFTFIGYLIALLAGGETAARICEFIYLKFIPVLVYCTTAMVLLGLIAMYLNGETALTGKRKK